MKKTVYLQKYEFEKLVAQTIVFCLKKCIFVV